MSSRNRLAELIALAREPSSTRRRVLLREITDLFLAEKGHSAGEMALFDGVLSKLAADMEEVVRAELAQRLAASVSAPRGLVRQLAGDAISVARPVLERSSVLSETDLLDVVRTRGQEHLRAVSVRSDLSESVSEAIVERGDDDTLGALVRNETAPLSRKAHEAVVERAFQNPALHATVVQRASLPADLLNEMYFVVEAKLRAHILQRNAGVDPATLEAALETGRKRLAARDGALPADYVEAEAKVRSLKARGALSSSTLVGFLRAGERSQFLIALSLAAEIDFHTTSRIVERRELDAMAILCKAADFDRTLFLTLAVLILGPSNAMGKAQEYGQLYNELPRDTALRTLRFWRIRREGGEAAAA